MKLLLDQNLSHKILGSLGARFEGSSHVRKHGLERASDDEVWQFAKDHGFVIVSKDVDFYERSLVEGAPPQVVWLNIGNVTTEQTIAKLNDVDRMRWLEALELDRRASVEIR